jgi:hypothetical protein
MLIRNITSKQDLDFKKKQQADLLKLSADNIALQQQRVQDFQNPNKPPPIPPQYKTSSEIEQDVMEQQKIAIDNLKSLNINFQIAAGVSQALLQQPEGIGNLVKLNRYFPAIKETFLKKFSPQALNNVDFIMEELDKAFEEIDNNLGFFKYGVQTTAPYEPKIVPKLILSSQNCQTLEDIVFAIKFLDTPLSGAKLQSIEDTLANLKAVSPTTADLEAVDTLGQGERNKIAKAARSIDGKSLTVERAKIIIDKFGDLKHELAQAVNGDFNAVTPQITQDIYTQFNSSEGQIAKAADLLEKGLTKVTPKLLADIDKLKNQIESDLRDLARASASLIGVPISAQQKQISLNKNKINESISYLDSKLEPLNHARLAQRMTSRSDIPEDNTQFKTFQDNDGNQAVVEVYGNRFINSVATTDGQPPAADDSNVIFEQIKTVNGRKTTIQRGLFKDVAGNDLQPENLDRYLYYAYKKINTAKGTEENFTVPSSSNLRYDLAELKNIAETIEGQYLTDRIDKDDTFNYVKNPAAATFAKQGFGFNAKRIKVGKGINKEADQPRYREFGKYIIHYPHLIEESILNLKFPSAGSIPSIKPVKIDDNYRQFIIDILDTNKVNKKHHQSLTQEEKNHFAKIARGAKITNTLNFNPEEEDDKDYKRLELLIGEINAGNDNPKIAAEIKQLLKKYVENGKISKLKATDILLAL